MKTTTCLFLILCSFCAVNVYPNGPVTRAYIVKAKSLEALEGTCLKMDCSILVRDAVVVDMIKSNAAESIKIVGKVELDDSLAVDIIQPVSASGLRVIGDLEASSAVKADVLAPYLDDTITIAGDVHVSDALWVNNLKPVVGNSVDMNGDLLIAGDLQASGQLNAHGLEMNSKDISGVKDVITVPGGRVITNVVEASNARSLTLNSNSIQVGGNCEFVSGEFRVRNGLGVTRAFLRPDGFLVFNDQNGVDTLVIRGGTNGRSRLDVYGTIFIDGNQVQASDERLKESIEIIAPAESLSHILLLKPSTYVLRREKSEGVSAPRHRGFIAQQVAEVLPEVVSVGSRERTVEDEKITDVLAIDYNGLTPDIVGAIQELKRQIDELRMQLAALNS